MRGKMGDGVQREGRAESAVGPERVNYAGGVRRTLSVWCDACGDEVEMVTAFDAAVRADVSSYTIYRWAETGVIHFHVTPKGVLFVCLRSLPRTT